jgi:hypothetical protein
MWEHFHVIFFLVFSYYSSTHNAKKKKMRMTCLIIVIIYCFNATQLCKEDDNAKTFPCCHFLKQLQLNAQREEEEKKAFKHIIVVCYFEKDNNVRTFLCHFYFIFFAIVQHTM